MIIRTQNKKMIVNFDNLDTICAIVINPRKEIKAEYETSIKYCCGGEETAGELGTYSTEEKAIKVLDMIQKQYASYSCRYGSDCSRYAVFQMPQDSEV